MIGSRQGIGGARATRIDRDDPEVLTELFQDGLDRGQSIGEGADHQQRDLAAPILVERDPRPTAECCPRAMALSLDPGPVFVRGREYQGLVITAICPRK